MDTHPPPPASRPLRADAQRNRARLLAAAEAAFAARGTEASLDEVARAAGVGIGTLYRHFPTRDDLVEAVIGDSVDEIVALADELAAAADAFAALACWLEALVRHATTYRGLAASLVAASCGEGRLADACHREEAAAAALVERAQRQGRVRPDVTVADVLDLASSIAWVSERGPRTDASRLLAITLDGLRAGAAHVPFGT